MKKLISLFVLVLLAVSAVSCVADNNVSQSVSDDLSKTESSVPENNDTEQSKTPEETSQPEESMLIEDNTPSEESENPSEPDNPPLYTDELAKDLFEYGTYYAQNGEWLYYVDDEYMLIGRVRIDGSGRMQYNNEGVQSANVAGDRIYYVNVNDGNRLYSMNHDGSGITKLCDDEVSHSLYYPLTVRDGRIYYSYNSGFHDGNTPWYVYLPASIKTDGTDRQKLEYVSFEEDGWTYTTVNEYTDYRVCKVRPDGSEKTIITDVAVDKFEYHDGWIYYSLNPDVGIYRVRTDGTDKQKISEDNGSMHVSSLGSSVLFDGERMFYRADNDKNYKHSLYVMNVDGTGRKELCTEGVGSLFYVYGDTLFFYFNGDLYSVSADGEDLRYICNPDYQKSGNCIWALEDGILYQENETLYFLSFNTFN